MIRAPNRTCSLRFHQTPDIEWQLMSRDIWTENPGIIARLNTSGNEDCLYDKARKCVGADPPFRYSVRIINEKCPNGTKDHSPIIRCLGPFPMGQPGVLLYPGASPSTYRQTSYDLQGLSNATWTVRSEVPLLVMVLTDAVKSTICPPPWGEKEVCDFSAVRKYALEGTDCYGTTCIGRLRKKASEHLQLVVAYPRFTAQERLMPEETPPTIADVRLFGWK